MAEVSKLLLYNRDEVEAFPIFENISKQWTGRTVLFWKILFLFDFIKHSGFQKYIQRVILANMDSNTTTNLTKIKK